MKQERYYHRVGEFAFFFFNIQFSFFFFAKCKHNNMRYIRTLVLQALLDK